MAPAEVEAVVASDIIAAHSTKVEGNFEQAGEAIGRNVSQRATPPITPTVPKRTNPQRKRMAPRKYREALVTAVAVWTEEEITIEERDQ